MTTRSKGMDHALYPYSPLPTRPKLDWPGKARLAWSTVLYLEYWELVAPEGTLRDPRYGDLHGNYTPEYRSFSIREYGNRIGVFRLLEIFDRLNLKVTVAANSEACVQYPYLIAALRERGYEFAAHGTHSTRMITSKMTEAEERDYIARSLDGVEKAAGARPKGWIGQDYSESTRTPQLLAEAGLDWLMDWANDDQPYAMTVNPSILSVPNQIEWDDVQQMWHRRILSPRWAAIAEEAFTALHEEGAVTGRFYGLHLHPWLAAMPHRIRYTTQLLEKLATYRSVWQATVGEVAAETLRNK